MLTVGLTGGIGAGKGEVARMLAAYGAVVVDADALAREALAPGSPGLAEVAAEFGPDVLAADGSLDRARLADVVFGDDAALARLEAIVHPTVGARSAELIAAAPEDAVVVYDVPLLVEKGLAGAYDLVVVVEAPEEVRVARVVEGRGMRLEDVRARVAAQASADERAAVADVVLDNSGTLDELEAQVGELWSEITARLA
ncbi:MAG: dephospho-CoA kinase [Actinomycetia bacterium]|nr:dephospho-CoA kinase [Actinomycetes bacterium]